MSSCHSSSAPWSSVPTRKPRGNAVRLIRPIVLTLLALPLLGGAGGGQSVPGLFLAIAAALVTAKVLGELAERVGQPAVLGELLAGVVLGGSVLGVVPTEGASGEVFHLLAELGVVLLLFEIGLETDLREMFRVGATSSAVAVVGVVLPFALGYAYWMYAPHSMATHGDLRNTAVFVGATLTATSVGITARVLSDLKRMHTKEARIIVGAAVIDDVLGLVILSAVSGAAAGRPVTTAGAARTLAIAVGFLGAALLIGRYLVPKLFDVVVRMRVRFVLLVFAVAFALGLGAAAAVAGSAMIVGAFAAGLILSGTNQFDTIMHEVRPVGSIFAPIFFVSVGASVNVGLLDPARPGAAGFFGIAGALLAAAVLGKLAAGWAAPWSQFRRIVVGTGMIPRGEVGLIFADIGRRAGIIQDDVFGAVVLVVMVTTFIVPPALKLLFGSGE